MRLGRGVPARDLQRVLLRERARKVLLRTLGQRVDEAVPIRALVLEASVRLDQRDWDWDIAFLLFCDWVQSEKETNERTNIYTHT